MKPFLSLCFACLALVVSSHAEVTFEDLFHLTPDAAERSLGATRIKILRAALEDYNAVLSYKEPIHATFDKDALAPMDGGTKVYKAAGYQLTVMRSQFIMGDDAKTGIPGYMYGPALTLGPELGVGNWDNFARVSFYPLDTLNKLLK